MKRFKVILPAVLVTIAILGGAMYWSNAMGLRTMLAKWMAANYEGKDLTGQRFDDKILDYANFRNAILKEAEFSNARLRFADLRGADLTDAGVSGADFSDAIFDGAILKIARGQETALYRNASFRNTNLQRISFHGMGGSQNRSTKKHLLDPGHGGADLSGAIFDGSNCQSAYFTRCTLVGASFRGSNCQDANFANADLTGVDFSNADLRGAKMDGAKTQGAKFTGAQRD